MDKLLKSLRVPVVQAPMAGVTTPRLVIAGCAAGALGSLAGSFMNADLLSQSIDEIRKHTNAPFAVNLFAVDPLNLSSEEAKRRIANARNNVAKYYTALGIEQPKEIKLPPTFTSQIEVVIEKKVPVFSFCFGNLDTSMVQKLKENGTLVVGTATCVEEAILLEKSGVDAVIAQGGDAGGHRGGFLQHAQDVGTFSLVPQVVDNVSVPVIAAGGIMDGRGVAAALHLGAAAAQMGTAFLTSVDSDANPLHKERVLSAKDVDTAVSKVYSGRPARGLRNTIMDELTGATDEGIAPYPAMQALTNPIKAAAMKEGNTELGSVWSGQAPMLATKNSSEQLIQSIEKHLKLHSML